jgi:RNA polymerase sigma-70 factor (ECF subfamily)
MDDLSKERVASLLRAAAAGDEDAWRGLVKEYSPRVFGLLRARCRDVNLAEEITQSVFVTIAEKLRDYDEEGRFDSWLFQIALNRLRDEMRRRARHAMPVEHEALESLAGAAEAAEGGYRTIPPAQRAALEHALASLNDADRQIIDLRFIAELSFATIAAMTDEPLGTLLARHHRALAKLRKLLERNSKQEF